MCIVAAIPLIVAGGLNAGDFVVASALCILLVIVAVAVNIFIRAGMVKGSYDKLLQQGDYTVEKKRSQSLISNVAGIYWLLVTAGYLAWSFYKDNWHTSWIVWPVAGVIFGAVAVVCRLVQRPRS